MKQLVNINGAIQKCGHANMSHLDTVEFTFTSVLWRNNYFLRLSKMLVYPIMFNSPFPQLCKEFIIITTIN